MYIVSRGTCYTISVIMCCLFTLLIHVYGFSYLTCKEKLYFNPQLMKLGGVNSSQQTVGKLMKCCLKFLPQFSNHPNETCYK